MAFPVLTHESQERAETEAKSRGYSAGYAAGIRQAEKEMERRRAELEVALAAEIREARAAAKRSAEAVGVLLGVLEARTTPVVADSQDILAASAIELAEAIIGHELSAGETSAHSAISRALSRVDATTVTAVRMNPDDLSTLNEVGMLDDFGARPDLELTADPSLSRGDAIAELPDGWLDARITTALARVKRELLGGAA